MTSITWASPRYVQEAATILGPQNRTQGSCGLHASFNHGSQCLLSIVKVLVGSGEDFRLKL